jgi:hypothetical protein
MRLVTCHQITNLTNNRSVMMRARLGRDVLLRVLLKGSLATRRAEVVGLALVLYLGRSILLINFHTTHRILDHLFHPLSVDV